MTKTTILFHTRETQELDEADMVALKCMLYRPPYLESSKTTPRFLVDSIKYLRVKYSLPLVVAMSLADAIVADSDNLFSRTRFLANCEQHHNKDLS